MKRGIICGLFLLMLVPAVYAETSIGEINGLYNLADFINVEVSLGANFETFGFLGGFLVCNGEEIEVHKSVQSLNSGESKTVFFDIILDREIIGNISGSCFIKARYGAEEVRSAVFQIVKDVKINFEIDDAFYEPGNSVNITGSVVKKNGNALNGFVEIIFEELELLNFDSPKRQENTEQSTGGETESGTENTEENKETTEDALELWKRYHPGEEVPPELMSYNYEINNWEEIDAEISDDENSSVKNESELEETEKSEESGEIDESADEESIELEIEEEGVQREPFILGSVVSEVVDGVFSINFIVPDNTPPGSYNVKVRVYDQDRYGNILNEGEVFSILNIRQIIRSLEIHFNGSSIVPGNEFVFRPVVYDQADNEAEGELEIKIEKPDSSVFMDKILKASESYSIFIETNYTPGYWKIRGKIGEIETERTLLVEELEMISSFVENGTLIIKNTGNVLFDKFVEISIGEVSEIKQLRLEVGESRRFRLSAPDGEYKIKITDGSEVQDLGVSFLTGRAISIDEIGGFFAENIWMLILLFIVVILVVILFVILKKLKKGPSAKIPKLVGAINTSAVAKSYKPLLPVEKPWEQTIDSGRKQEAALISLKIKNFEEIKNLPISKRTTAFQRIDDALLGAKSAGAKIYVDGEYRIIIFSQMLIKGDYDIKSIKIARDIEEILNRHNKTSETKINYGVGVHSGDMAVEEKEGKIKFVSLGNTVAIAKRISEISDSEVLISEQLRKKTLGKLKADKKNGFWSVKEITDREQYDDFVSKFLNRQKEG